MGRRMEGRADLVWCPSERAMSERAVLWLMLGLLVAAVIVLLVKVF